MTPLSRLANVSTLIKKKIVIFYTYKNYISIFTILIFSEGYYMVDYRYHIVPNKLNKSIYNISPNPELNDIGGNFTATAELRGNSWIIYLRKISEENSKTDSFLKSHLSLKNVDMVQIRKIDPENPNVLINELKDVKSGTTMVSYFDKQL